MMKDICIVAEYFLFQSSMTHKKLQKLCYYAQAWHLANYGEPLMPNRFEAWIHGPVSPDLYHKYKDWGWTYIPQFQKCPSMDSQEEAIIKQVFEVYGPYTADELENMTHNELPWKKAREGCKPFEYSRNPISTKDMRDYYGNRINRSYN